MNTHPPIDRFRGAFAFLSNFYTVSVQYEDTWYRTAEHAYQAAKSTDFAVRAHIARQVTPARAKFEGRKIVRRADWDVIKIRTMEQILRSKFRVPRLRVLLLNTRPCELIEGNTWGDTFWGVCDGKGRNHLGRLLMKIRDEVAKEDSCSTTES